MRDLEHGFETCTGNWRLVGAGEARSIRCDVCAAEAAATPDHRLSAIDENYAGIYMRRLATEGAALLAADRGRRR